MLSSAAWETNYVQHSLIMTRLVLKHFSRINKTKVGGCLSFCALITLDTAQPVPSVGPLFLEQSILF